MIFLDPPTFSRSKSMEDTLDIQRDHMELIRNAAALLEPEGILIFSTNLRRFKLDREALAGLEIEDITRRTIPPGPPEPPPNFTAAPRPSCVR